MSSSSRISTSRWSPGTGDHPAGSARSPSSTTSPIASPVCASRTRTAGRAMSLVLGMTDREQRGVGRQPARTRSATPCRRPPGAHGGRSPSATHRRAARRSRTPRRRPARTPTPRRPSTGPSPTRRPRRIAGPAAPPSNGVTIHRPRSSPFGSSHQTTPAPSGVTCTSSAPTPPRDARRRSPLASSHDHACDEPPSFETTPSWSGAASGQSTWSIRGAVNRRCQSGASDMANASLLRLGCGSSLARVCRTVLRGP